jgi:predicted ABC-type sugar transport system permease subunit
VLSNSLNMVGVSSFLQVVVVGLVILVAVIVDRLRSKAG